MSDISKNNKRIAKNTLMLYIRMFFTMAIGLYTSRIVLQVLGITDYGTYNVVAGFVSFFSFFNATLSASMQRFYNFEGSKYGNEGYKKVYITGLVINIIIAFILFILLESIGLWYINNIMVVPDGREAAVNVVFQFSILSMIFIFFQIPFLGAIMAKEYMNFYAIISIFDVILRLIAIILLQFIQFDKLIIYSFLQFIISIFIFLSYLIFAKRKILCFRFTWNVDKLLFKSLLSFSGWNLFGTLLFMMKGQGLNMLLNLYFGPIVNAARGIATQVSNAVASFSANIMTAYRPQIVNSYANKQYERTKELMFTESRICFYLMLLLITPVIIEIDFLLHLWLGNSIPENSSIFSRLVLIDVLICSLNTPCTQVVWAVGDIKKYQIATGIVNFFLLPTSYILLEFGMEAESVFIVTIVFSCLNQIAALITANKIFNFGLYEYFIRVILPCIVATIILPIMPYLVSKLINVSFLRLIIIGIITIFAAIPVLFILTNKGERNQIVDYLKVAIIKINYIHK